MIDSVTHKDKVIITKGGQQMGPTLSTMGGGGAGGLLFTISKGKYLAVNRKFSTVLYVLN